jgi:hypothetical protein
LLRIFLSVSLVVAVVASPTYKWVGMLASESSRMLYGIPGSRSEFLRRGSLGYSPSAVADQHDGLELDCLTWDMQPLHVSRLESELFDNSEWFPAGSATFDGALLMRNLEHFWYDRGSLSA